jgi:DNA-binding SARP family transcriptional activator/tetratricopeptide (TPR) repeat protein
VEFRLLGRLEAEHDGRSVELGRRRERCLLGVLLLEANKPVPVDRLVDLLWDGEAPSTARASLHTHVSRLRSRLDPDGTGRLGLRLVSRDGGYLAQVDRLSIDAHRFQALVARARAADATERVDLLRQALALWRGEVLAGVASPRLRDRVGAELGELRMSATELMVDAELDGGRHRELVGELSALTAEHPYRERLAGQLMLALYRSDRYADALTVYQQLRDRLSDDLGADPGPELRELHGAILRRDPRLAGRSVAVAVPAQLPPAPAWFTGRSDELATLTKALTHEAERGGTVVVSAVGGAGGVGKTWLALHWAHQHLDWFPDGQLFVNLRGFDPSGRPMPPTTAVRGFLDALGVAPAAVPVDLDAQVGLYRSLVAGRRMLIVLDNARDTSQVADLLPGSATCMVIVTSRDRLTGLVAGHGAHPLPLDTLEEGEARDLLGRRLGKERLAGEPDAVVALLAGCGGLPLALGIAAARAVMQPQLGLAAIAADLRDAATRLGALDEGDPQASLRAVLSWSYQTLASEQARVFAVLGLATGPDIGLPAAAALTGLPTAEVEVVLRALERQSLVHQHTPGRWRMHDLVRLYASEQAVRDQPEDGRQAALRRLVDFYLHTAYAGDRLLDPHRPSTGKPVSGSPGHPLHDQGEALAWFEAEHACLLGAQRLAAGQGWDQAVWQLAWTLDTFHQRQGHLDDDVVAWRAGLASAYRLDDAAIQSQAHRLLGHAYTRMGRQAESLEHLAQALTLAERIGDANSQAHAHGALAGTWGKRGDIHRALEHAYQALRLQELLDNPVWQADALNTLGWYQTQLGNYETAQVQCERALILCRRHQDRDGEAHTLDSLGYIAHRTGRYPQALDCYQQALALFRELGNAYGEADTLDHLGETHAEIGHHDQAIDAWRRALRLYQTQHRTTDADRIRQQLDGPY